MRQPTFDLQSSTGTAYGGRMPHPRQSEETFVVLWPVSLTDLVLDVVRALGSHRSAVDVHSYGVTVLSLPWTYEQVLREMRTLLEEGRLVVVTEVAA